MYSRDTPLSYNKIGVYRGIHNFLIFALKHRLCVPTIYVLSKNKEISQFFIGKLPFLQPLKSLHIAWACFRNEEACFCSDCTSPVRSILLFGSVFVD